MFCSLILLPISPVDAEDDILTLSIEELMAIPMDKPAVGRGIFQSDRFPVRPDTVNFGMIVPLQKFPYSTAAILAAADLATEEINKQGGINGQTLAIVRADNEHVPEISVSLAQTLVRQFSVKAFIGPMTSESARAVLTKVAGPEKIPLITVRASASMLNRVSKDTSFWRLTANNQRQVHLIFSELRRLGRLDRVALIGSRDVYSEEIVSGLTSLFNEHNKSFIDVVKISNKVDLKLLNLSSRIKAIKKKNPTAIIVTIRPDLSADLLIKLNRQWANNPPLILMGDTFNKSDARQFNLGKIIHCTKYIVSTESKGVENIDSRLAPVVVNTSISGYDTAYAFDAVILLAMAKQLAENTELSFDEAMFRLTGDGYQVTYRDYQNIVELYKKHQILKYFGVSGYVMFDRDGENKMAELSWQILGDNNEHTPDCILPLTTRQ